jgi:hypothetical protein
MGWLVQHTGTHVNQPLPPHGFRPQISFTYSDGFGREVQTKIQAEPGFEPLRVPEANIGVPCVDRIPGVVINNGDSAIWSNSRRVGTGRKIYNNKGSPLEAMIHTCRSPRAAANAPWGGRFPARRGVGRLMSKVADKSKLQQALDGAAINAKRGSTELRAGRFVVGRDKVTGRFVMRRDDASVRSGARKK